VSCAGVGFEYDGELLRGHACVLEEGGREGGREGGVVILMLIRGGGEGGRERKGGRAFLRERHCTHIYDDNS